MIFMDFLYAFLAIIGLGLLVFIHELGHYFVALKVGMRIEVFSIGFGKPLCSWNINGIKWQLGSIPFGGYVKIGGMEKEGNLEPFDIPDGYFGKSPLDRIKVVFTGPLVNIVFSLLLFTLIFITGGREKSFSQHTQYIGWVDPQSKLYEYGVKAGDKIVSYDNNTFYGEIDHIYSVLLSDNDVKIKGIKIDHQNNIETPFKCTVYKYPHQSLNQDIFTTGILCSASYLIYDSNEKTTLPVGYSAQNNKIQSGDRILWADGELIFSPMQLSNILNDGKILLTIQRNDEILLKRVPRIIISDLKLQPHQKSEIIDWFFEANIKENFSKQYYIPYDIDLNCVVESSIPLIDVNKYNLSPPQLFKGDKILAVDGVHVDKCYDIVSYLQKHFVNIIVERNPDINKLISWKVADDYFYKGIDWNVLNTLIKSVGTNSSLKSKGMFHLLNPIIPKKLTDFDMIPSEKAMMVAKQMEQRKHAEKISNPERRDSVLKQLDLIQNRLMLGMLLHDKRVSYNPNPFTLTFKTISDTARTLKALFLGRVNMKWLNGPIGMVQIIHHGWSVGIKEALFWIAVISLGLGIFNLLPIPGVDGGLLILSTIEIITKKKMDIKVLNRLILPFYILIVGMLIFLTYNDITRLIHHFFR